MQRYLLIGLGGALGSMLRYAVGASVAERTGTRFPLGTLTVNVAACFLIGLSIEYLGRHTSLSPAWRYLIPIGFIGGFSTFSTFEWEVWLSLRTGAFWMGVLYVGVSVVVGLVAVAAGAGVARGVR